VGLGNNAHLTLLGIYRSLSVSMRALSKLLDLLSNYAKFELLIVDNLTLDWLIPGPDGLKDICTELNLI
jgi:hypothetical protein